MKHSIELLDINGIPAAAARGVALIRIPTEDALRLHEIHLELTNAGGQTMAQVYDDVIVEVGGKPQRIHTAAEASEVQALWNPEYGVANDVPGGTALVTIMFSELFRKQYAATEIKSWDIEQGQSCLIKVNILALAASSPNVKAFAEVEFADEIIAAGGQFNPGRSIVRQHRDTFQVNSNKADINNIAKDMATDDRLSL
jgi:hypothetical protein